VLLLAKSFHTSVWCKIRGQQQLLARAGRLRGQLADFANRNNPLHYTKHLMLSGCLYIGGVLLNYGLGELFT